jgi:hypothetical protein
MDSTTQDIEGQLTSSMASEESVGELFQIVQRLVEDERARGQALEAKTSTLAGFTGAILALVAGFGRDLFRLDLGGAGDIAFAAAFAVAVVALAAGAILAVFGVLRPQERLAIARGEIRKFSTFPLIATPPMEIRGRMINTLVAAFERERSVNDRKARLTQQAALALVVGLVSVAAEALTVSVASFR